MVAITVGLFLMAGLATFMVNTVVSHASAMKSSRLNQEMRAVMTLMVREIRRSGYWGSPSSTAGSLGGVGAGTTYSNPFKTINTATAGCILFTYDANGSGTQDTSSPDERYGFLLNNGVIQMRTGVSATLNDCTTSAGNAWGNLTDSKNTKFTALTFAETDSAPVYAKGTSGPNIVIRYVTITMTGQLANDATVQQTLTETVELENDLFSPT
jgi:type II secretory pathway component PulJ